MDQFLYLSGLQEELMVKKILFYTENYAYGGGNRYLVDLINSLSDSFEHIILTTNPQGIFLDDIERLNKKIQTAQLPILTRGSFSFAFRKIKRYIKLPVMFVLMLLSPVWFIYDLILFSMTLKRLKPTVVVSCNGGYPAAQSPLILLIAAKIARISAYLSIVSMPKPRANGILYLEKIRDYMVWSSAAAVIVNARAIADGLRYDRGLPAEQVHILYNGLEDSPCVTSPVKVLERLKIGCISRMDYSKGIIFLIDAFYQLAETYPHIDLVLAGEGDASEEIKRQVSQSIYRERIHVLGFFRGDILALLAEMDIYVFPSLHEGFPYSILEAMRASRPIVSTNVGGIPEAINNGVEGILVPPASAVELALGIETLLLDEALRIKMGKNAYVKFANCFTLRQMREQAVRIIGP